MTYSSANRLREILMIVKFRRLKYRIKYNKIKRITNLQRLLWRISYTCNYLRQERTITVFRQALDNLFELVLNEIFTIKPLPQWRFIDDINFDRRRPP